MHHTQDVKSVAWHPHEEVSVSSLPPPSYHTSYPFILHPFSATPFRLHSTGGVTLLTHISGALSRYSNPIRAHAVYISWPHGTPLSYPLCFVLHPGGTHGLTLETSLIDCRSSLQLRTTILSTSTRMTPKRTGTPSMCCLPTARPSGPLPSLLMAPSLPLPPTIAQFASFGVYLVPRPLLLPTPLRDE